MANTESEVGNGTVSYPPNDVERVIYVMPRDPLSAPGMDDVDLAAIWRLLWRKRWVIVWVTAAFAAASVAYALLAEEWFRAEAVLSPKEEQSLPALGGQLGGLAALAGVPMGRSNTVEAIATLKSRDFARSFIEEQGLLTVFFRDQWDAENNRWYGTDPEEWPDVRDAVEFFHDNVLKVEEDRNTSLVTLAVEWTDPDTAAAWANTLARRLNEKMRDQALSDARSNVEFLQEELSSTGVVTLQESIGRLLESELQKLMLARGNSDFAFRIVDSATVPKEREYPNRRLVAVLGTLLGGMLGVFGVIAWYLLGLRQDAGDDKLPA